MPPPTAPSTSWNSSKTAASVYYNEENIGFAAAQNQAIKLSNGDWVLTLNPDVLLLPNFIQALVDAGQFDPRIGTVCGKLLTMTRALRDSRKARWWIPPASISTPCCATWTAAARKWITATTCNTNMSSAPPPPRRSTAAP